MRDYNGRFEKTRIACHVVSRRFKSEHGHRLRALIYNLTGLTFHLQHRPTRPQRPRSRQAATSRRTERVCVDIIRGGYISRPSYTIFSIANLLTQANSQDPELVTLTSRRLLYSSQRPRGPSSYIVSGASQALSLSPRTHLVRRHIHLHPRHSFALTLTRRPARYTC